MKINIPNPCVENYDNMSSTYLGKICSICNTEVIDFSNWETKDIITYIQSSNQKVCGRIKSSQQQRINNKTRFLIWLKVAGLASLISFYKPIFGQTHRDNEIIFTGQVKSNRGHLVNYGYIINNYSSDTGMLDMNGKFYLKLNKMKQQLPLRITIAALGYDTKTIEIKKSQNRMIILEETWIGEIQVKTSLKNRIKRIVNIFSIKDKD